MIDGKTILAIIPARGGSKRVPRKNLANLAGKPLITYTIEAGLKANYIDELVVSTDDHEIAAVAKSSGASVPFIRPYELAQDESSTLDVIKNVIDFYKKTELKLFDYILLLQPTSPLRDYAEINKAIEILADKKADALVSVCETEHSPLWTNTLPADLSLVNFIKDEVKNKRSQDLEKYYRLNGAIYICNSARFLNEETFFIKGNIYAYIMSQEKSVDIDTIIDFALCEILLQNNVNMSHE